MRNLVAGEWCKIIGEEFRRVNEKKAQAMEILAGELSDFSTSPQVSVSWCSSSEIFFVMLFVIMNA